MYVCHVGFRVFCVAVHSWAQVLDVREFVCVYVMRVLLHIYTKCAPACATLTHTLTTRGIRAYASCCRTSLRETFDSLVHRPNTGEFLASPFLDPRSGLASKRSNEVPHEVSDSAKLHDVVAKRRLD